MPKGKPNKRYTPEFKIKVVETMHREKLIKYVCLTFRTSLPAILRKTDDKADKIAEKQSPPEPQCSEGFVLYLAETAIKNIFRQIQTSA